MWHLAIVKRLLFNIKPQYSCIFPIVAVVWKLSIISEPRKQTMMNFICSSLHLMNFIKIINRIYVWAHIQTVWALGTGRTQISYLLEISIQGRNFLSFCKRYRKQIMFMSLRHKRVSCADYIAISSMQTIFLLVFLFYKIKTILIHFTLDSETSVYLESKQLNLYCW